MDFVMFRFDTVLSVMQSYDSALYFRLCKVQSKYQPAVGQKMPNFANLF